MILLYTTKQSRKEVNDLHDSCVITPFDETNGNVALICKRFYALHLFREFGIKKSQSANTYEHHKNVYEHRKNVNQDSLLKIHADHLFRYFGISVSEDN